MRLRRHNQVVVVSNRQALQHGIRFDEVYTGSLARHIGTEQMVARLDPQTRARRGEVLSLWFDPAQMHLFDAETGRSLTS